MDPNRELKSITACALMLLVLSSCRPATAAPTSEASPPTLILSETPPEATQAIPADTSVPPTHTPTQPPSVGTDITIQLPEGDAARGQTLGEKAIPNAGSCEGCHIGSRPPGPKFEASDDTPAIGQLAGIRIADPDYAGNATTVEQYLFESIVLPDAYLVEGPWMFPMPGAYSEKLSLQDVADLIAWMLTFK